MALSGWMSIKKVFSFNVVPTRVSNMRIAQRCLHKKPVIILGIETSCDDTGCGIVDENGNVLGEAINSQTLTHVNYGGIIPTFAADMHRQNITDVCEKALKSANLRLRDVDAIAATVKPGLCMSLQVGMDFGKYLSRIGNKPFIPIHHMEAHALTARMTEKVDFPYLALLISGGHSLLVIVENVEKFYILGSTLDNAPGELIDKVSRRLKLKNIPEFRAMSGGQAIEMAARKADNVDEFPTFPVMHMYTDCNFSFSGITSNYVRCIEKEEAKYKISGAATIPSVYNLCAAFQFSFIEHICQRTQRAMLFANTLPMFSDKKRSLVVSGGVASNNMLAKGLGILCSEMDYNFVRTPPKWCTDNGVMIAWNGVERWIANAGVLTDEYEIENVTTENKASLGKDWRKQVKDAMLKCQWVKIKKKLLQND